MNTHSPLKKHQLRYYHREKVDGRTFFPLTLRPKLTLTSVKYLRDIKVFKQTDDSNHPFPVKHKALT